MEVTIGLPIYNEEKYIERTLKGILENIDDITMVIICDNASTDATGSICKQYAKMHSKIKYYCRKKNIGSWPNMVRTLQMVETEGYMQLGGHDVMPFNYIHTLKNMYQENESAVCVFGRTVNRFKNNPLKDTYYEYANMLCSEDWIERFCGYLECGGTNMAYYGLMQTDVFKAGIKICGSYKGLGMDNLVIAYMAIKGKLIYDRDVSILIKAEKTTRKEVFRRYRKYGMYVPYINPGKIFYKKAFQLIEKEKVDENFRRKLRKILNTRYIAYKNDFVWFLHNYNEIY